MKRYRIITYCCFGLFLALLRCAEEPFVPEILNNEELLFTTAAPIDIWQGEEADDISFVVGDNVDNWLHLAIYETPPQLVGEEVEEGTPPMWSFFGQVTAGRTIGLADGSLREDVEALDLAFFLCSTDNLYWVAWSWEETAHFVTHSSKRVNLLNEPSRRPALTLLDVEKIGSGPADTLLRAGNEVRLRLRIGNVGELTATDIRYSLRQDRISGLPRDASLANIIANDDLTEEVTFVIPEDAVFGDDFVFQLLFTSNNCVDVASEFTLRVNSVKVSIVDIRLTRILWAPAGGLWDFCALPVSFNPDIYYELYSPSALLKQSLDIDDVDLNAQPHVVDFPNLTPPIELAIDTTYRIEFWDDDLCIFPAEPDFIGVTEFNLLDRLTTRPPIIYDTTELIIAEIHLQWE